MSSDLIPSHQPSQVLPPTRPYRPVEHTQVLPELGLDSNLQQLVLKQDPVILAHKPRWDGEEFRMAWPRHLSCHPCPSFLGLTYSAVHQLQGWEGRCPQDLGWGRGKE